MFQDQLRISLNLLQTHVLAADHVAGLHGADAQSRNINEMRALAFLAVCALLFALGAVGDQQVHLKACASASCDLVFDETSLPVLFEVCHVLINTETDDVDSGVSMRSIINDH